MTKLATAMATVLLVGVASGLMAKGTAAEGNQSIHDLSVKATPLVPDSSLRLQIGRPYKTSFKPTVTFSVPTTEWWGYERDVTAFNLRKATGPGDAQIIADEGIEVVVNHGTLPSILKTVRAAPGLSAGPVTKTRVGPYPARFFDASGSSTWNAPPALSGEQLDPSDRARIYVFSKGKTSIIALIVAKASSLQSFLPEAEKTVRSIRVR